MRIVKSDEPIPGETNFSLSEFREQAEARAKEGFKKTGHRVSTPVTNLTPVPLSFRKKVREKIFDRLVKAALLRGSEEKAKLQGMAEGKRFPLTKGEKSAIVDALRAELERRGFWKDPGGSGESRGVIINPRTGRTFLP